LFPYPKLGRCKDVSFLSIGIVKQSDPGRSVRVILNGSHSGRNLPFVSLEVNESISSLMPPSFVPRGDPPIAVSSSGLSQGKKKTPLRCGRGDLLKCGDGLKSFSRRGWSKLFDTHLSTPFNVK
jgi:hypothetical protein